MGKKNSVKYTLWNVVLLQFKKSQFLFVHHVQPDCKRDARLFSIHHFEQNKTAHRNKNNNENTHVPLRSIILWNMVYVGILCCLTNDQYIYYIYMYTIAIDRIYAFQRFIDINVMRCMIYFYFARFPFAEEVKIHIEIWRDVFVFIYISNNNNNRLSFYKSIIIKSILPVDVSHAHFMNHVIV